jgi:hypothetical protein
MINTIANTATEIGFAKLTVHPAQAILLGGIFVCLLCYNKTGLISIVRVFVPFI